MRYSCFQRIRDEGWGQKKDGQATSLRIGEGSTAAVDGRAGGERFQAAGRRRRRRRRRLLLPCLSARLRRGSKRRGSGNDAGVRGAAERGSEAGAAKQSGAAGAKRNRRQNGVARSRGPTGANGGEIFFRRKAAGIIFRAAGSDSGKKMPCCSYPLCMSRK
jgi:hypothetical protein